MSKSLGLGRRALQLGVLAAAMGALASLPARAQGDLEERVQKLEEKAEKAWSVKWDNGFKVDSPDGNFKLKFGGRIQNDYTFIASQDQVIEDNFGYEDGTEFRRARLFVSGTVYDKIIFKAQYDFAGGDADFKDVWLGFEGEGYEVKIGHYKEPFSLGELTSSKYTAFLERALPNVFSPSRNTGISVWGSNDRMSWGVGYFYDANDFGISVDEDATNLTGRFVYRPLFEDGGERLLHIGLSYTDKDTFGLGEDGFRIRSRAEFHDASNRIIDTGHMSADGESIADLELGLVLGSFWASGEYFDASVDRFNGPGLGGGTTDLGFDGYYVQAGYYLTGEHRRYNTGEGAWDRQKPKHNLGDGGSGAWEVAARYSELSLSDKDVAGGDANAFTVAVNWYPTPNTRFMLNYVMTDREEGIFVPAEDRIEGSVDAVLVRAQIDF